MNHPNAIAAFVAAQSAVAVQWLLERYAHRSLTDNWKAEVVADVTVAVLYVGRNGLKAALQRSLGAARALWNGPGTPARPTK